MKAENLLNEIVENNKTVGASIDSVFVTVGDSICNYKYKHTALHELRSASKLVVALAYGLVLNKRGGYLEHRLLPIFEKFLPEGADREKISQWTIRTLLTHSTGFDKMMIKAKDVEGLTDSEILNIIFSTKINNQPNVDFTYNNVEAFLLSVVFQETFKINLSEFVKENIFKPLDITNFKWTNYGKYCAGCTGLYLCAEDFHKLGLLLINDGVYGGKQIIPKEWIEEMTKSQILTPNAFKAERVFPKFSAGYFTFQTPDGIVFRDGANGQYIICDQKNKVVVSILSTEKDISKVTEVFRNTSLCHNSFKNDIQK